MEVSDLSKVTQLAGGTTRNVIQVSLFRLSLSTVAHDLSVLSST